MRFSLIVLIFCLLSVGFVKADTQSCVDGITKCTDAACLTAILAWGTCSNTNGCAAKVSNISDYKTCIGTTCASTNSDAQAYINKVVDCVDGSIFRFAFVALIGLFFAF